MGYIVLEKKIRGKKKKEGNICPLGGIQFGKRRLAVKKITENTENSASSAILPIFMPLKSPLDPSRYSADSRPTA
jgi:hypothetical protein